MLSLVSSEIQPAVFNDAETNARRVRVIWMDHSGYTMKMIKNEIDYTTLLKNSKCGV